jgi:hypothetical protein
LAWLGVAWRGMVVIGYLLFVIGYLLYSVLKLALKELTEGCVWLRVVCRAEILNAGRVEQPIDENQQLCRIVNASIATSKRKNDL